MTSYILTDSTLTLYHNDQVLAVRNDHQAWDKIIEAVKADDYDEAVKLADSKHAVEQFTSTSGVTFNGSTVYFNGIAIHNTFTSYLLRMMSEGFNIDPLTKCLENLMKNPSYRAREQFGAFMEANQLPITPDGCFMAYKLVNEHYKDCHSNTFDNSVGQVLSMDRTQVDDDPTRTCSAGFHVCGLEYLKHFYGAHLMACKVSPEHVVSVPTDYENSKMRVSQYEVVAELPIELVRSDDHSEWKTSVYESPEEDDDDEDECEDYEDEDEEDDFGR